MSTILEVAVGLGFIYLLFSLLASALNEAVLGYLANLRARVLEQSIRALLSNEQSHSSLVHFFKTIGAFFRRLVSIVYLPRRPVQPSRNFAEQVLSHPSVQGLKISGGTCPSYLPAETFADAVVGNLVDLAKQSGSAARSFANVTVADLAAGMGSLKDTKARQVLDGILAGTQTIPETRERLETWFNNSMARVTGLYKRYTQFWLYVWATLIVVWLNVDTIEIGKRLFADAQLRGTLVSQAAAFIADTNNVAMINAMADNSARPVDEINTPLTGASRTNSTANRALAMNSVTNPPPVSLVKVQDEIDRLKLPLGWGDCHQVDATNSICGWLVTRLPRLIQSENKTNAPSFLASGILSGTTPCPVTPADWCLKALGLFITIAAVSQGAPFWFDLLNRFTNLRAAGRPPAVGKPQPERT